MKFLLIFLFFIAPLFISAGFVVYRLAYYNGPKEKGLDAGESIATNPLFEAYREQGLKGYNFALTHPYTEYSVQSVDGLTLRGRFYDFNPDGPVFLEFHGYHSNMLRDLSPTLEEDYRRGVSIFMVDQRGLGTSDGHVTTMGIKERLDVPVWAKFLAEGPCKGRDIYIFGVSLGGATVTMASSATYPSSVRGIIADCPFSSPRKIVLSVAKSTYHVPKWLAYPAASMGAMLFGQFYLNETNAVREVKRSALPILLFHGTADQLVPFSMSEAIAAANPEKVTFVPVEGAGHGVSCYKDMDRYFGAIEDFIDRTKSGEC